MVQHGGLQRAAPYTYGNSGRNNVYGPGQQTLDLTLARKFKIKENGTFELRLGAFNSLNKVNLATPNRFVNTPQFGTITTSDTPGRQDQINAKLHCDLVSLEDCW